jgi:hypothetical protein
LGLPAVTAPGTREAITDLGIEVRREDEIQPVEERHRDKRKNKPCR